MLLHHGTTRDRALAIVANGPDPTFREGAGPECEGFFVSRANGPFDRSPSDYARAKAATFPRENGPAIVEFELPDETAEQIIAPEGQLINGMALDVRVEIAFQPDGGLERLRAIWAGLKKQVIAVEESPK